MMGKEGYVIVYEPLSGPKENNDLLRFYTFLLSGDYKTQICLRITKSKYCSMRIKPFTNLVLLYAANSTQYSQYCC